MDCQGACVLKTFSGDLAFCSNFASVPGGVELPDEPDVKYPSVEHAYAAGKTRDLAARVAVRRAETPGKAKRLGRHLAIRSEWDGIKLGVMAYLLAQKFAPGTEHARRLVETDGDLVEYNTWGDTYWGVCQGKGENWLGRLLMAQRNILRREA